MILSLGYTCVIAKSVFIPVTLALILQACFAPVVGFLRARGVGRVVSSLLVVSCAVGLVVAGVLYLAEPAARWIEELPRNTAQLRGKMEQLQGPVEDVRRVTEQVEELTSIDDDSGKLTVVVDGEPSLLSVLVSRTSETALSVLATLALLFLLLAHDGEFLKNLESVLPHKDQREQARRIIYGFQREISGYLFAITLINIGLGVVLGLALWGLGMPSPILWGVMAIALNFMPYVGAIIGVAIVGMVSLISSESGMQALLPPLVYLGLTSLEGGLITPAIIGRKLTLRPAIVLVWLLIWSFLWGIAGALLAFPLLMAFKILCDHLEFLRPIGIVLATAPPAPDGPEEQTSGEDAREIAALSPTDG